MCAASYLHIILFYLLFALFLILTSPENIIEKKLSDDLVLITHNVCSKVCNDEPHTLCSTRHEHKSCPQDKFIVYDFEKFLDVDFRQLLLDGHNGLRNRFAYSHQISNMAKMYWNKGLARMAAAWARNCKPFKDDECTHILHPLKFTEILDYYEKDQEGEDFISQNRFCYKASYVPRYLVQMALSCWYLEKNLMETPVLTNFTFFLSNLSLKSYAAGTNFSHLIYPLTKLMGCAMARYDDHVCIICNYYPFYINPNNYTDALTGKPGSECPFMFPMRDDFYNGLCTGEISRGVVQLSDSIFLRLFCMIFSICILFYV